MCVNTEIVRIGEFAECLSFICVFHIAIRCKRMTSCNLLLLQVNLYISFSIFPVVRTPVFVIYEATRMSEWIENYHILRKSMSSTYDTLLRSYRYTRNCLNEIIMPCTRCFQQYAREVVPLYIRSLIVRLQCNDQLAFSSTCEEYVYIIYELHNCIIFVMDNSMIRTCTRR